MCSARHILPEFGIGPGDRNEVATRCTAFLEDELRRNPDGDLRAFRGHAFVSLLVEYELSSLADGPVLSPAGRMEYTLERLSLTMALPAALRDAIMETIRQVKMYLLRRDMVQQYLLASNSAAPPNSIIPLPLSELLGRWRASFHKLRRVGAIDRGLSFTRAVAGLRQESHHGLQALLVKAEQLREHHAKIELHLYRSLQATTDINECSSLPPALCNLVEEFSLSLAVLARRGIRLQYDTIDEFIFGLPGSFDPGVMALVINRHCSSRPRPLVLLDASAPEIPAATPAAATPAAKAAFFPGARRASCSSIEPIQLGWRDLLMRWRPAAAAAMAIGLVALTALVALATGPQVETDAGNQVTTTANQVATRQVATRQVATEQVTTEQVTTEQVTTEQVMTNQVQQLFPVSGRIFVGARKLNLCRNKALPRSLCPNSERGAINNRAQVTIIGQDDSGWYHLRLNDNSTWWGFAFYIKLERDPGSGYWLPILIDRSQVTVYSDEKLIQRHTKNLLEGNRPFVARPSLSNELVLEVMGPTGPRGYIDRAHIRQRPFKLARASSPPGGK